MQPWYREQRFRFAAAALLAGLVIGGLVTVALGYKGSPRPPISERSDAEAIASDHAAVAKPAATATAAPKAAAKAARKPKHAQASVAVSSAAGAEPTATSTPDDEERGSSPAASTPAPARSTPRRSTPRLVSKPRTQITPVTKKTPAKSAPTPTPAAPAPTPAPTAAPPAPAATATPDPPHRPPGGPHGGNGDDDDPGTS